MHVDVLRVIFFYVTTKILLTRNHMLVKVRLLIYKWDFYLQWLESAKSWEFLYVYLWDQIVAQVSETVAMSIDLSSTQILVFHLFILVNVCVPHGQQWKSDDIHLIQKRFSSELLHCTLLHTQTAKHHGCNKFVHCCMPRL